MNQNLEDLKNKIIYRASYRGTKEMDILMTEFIKSIIHECDQTDLYELDKLVSLDDEILLLIKKNQQTNILIKKRILDRFIKFKN